MQKIVAGDANKMKNKLQQLKQEILTRLEKVTDVLSLENLEKKYLGRKGELILLLKKIGSLPEAATKKKCVLQVSEQ